MRPARRFRCHLLDCMSQNDEQGSPIAAWSPGPS
ncbi:hypothetical protein PspLS_11599 [Pyricularia sp. CBS 133598]|nr:hypothetical protein PspLS_11599 [Pyricularia sp. CBS 133598]